MIKKNQYYKKINIKCIKNIVRKILFTFILINAKGI